MEKAVLITGASEGIGKGLAKQFHNVVGILSSHLESKTVLIRVCFRLQGGLEELILWTTQKNSGL